MMKLVLWMQNLINKLEKLDLVDLQKEEAANVPITIESKINNHASWSNKKLGRIVFVPHDVGVDPYDIHNPA